MHHRPISARSSHQRHPTASLLAALCAGLALGIALPHPADAQTRVYRCTGADGAIEFRQQACETDQDAARIELEDNRTGWVPPPAETLAKPGRPPKTAKAKPKSAGERADTDKDAERCWKKRQQIEHINAEMRAGYTPARGETLKRRRREYRDYLRTFCR